MIVHCGACGRESQSVQPCPVAMLGCDGFTNKGGVPRSGPLLAPTEALKARIRGLKGKLQTYEGCEDVLLDRVLEIVDSWESGT